MDIQATQAGRPHYPILDGLRGTAALLVVAFHLMESMTPDQSANHCATATSPSTSSSPCRDMS